MFVRKLFLSTYNAMVVLLQPTQSETKFKHYVLLKYIAHLPTRSGPGSGVH